MCTVTYYPTGKGDFILTSNRDESPQRPMASAPSLYRFQSEPVIFPKDPQAGGTWIACSQSHTLCLLNGADQLHQRKLPYRKSRGLILLDFFTYRNVRQYVEFNDFSGIEPFTLVIVDHQLKQLNQLRWNGQRLECLEMNADQAHIWSSHTLYTHETVANRKSWFETFLQGKKTDAPGKDLLDFHRFGGTGDPEQDLVMSREGRVMTVSITQINCYNGLPQMEYADLRTGEKHKLSFSV